MKPRLAALVAPIARFAGGGAVAVAVVAALLTDGALADAAPRVGPSPAVPGLALPGPGARERPQGADVAAANAACEKCHTDIAKEWRGSMHQEAWTDPVFQEAYDIEPLPFCRGCHAPESDPEAMPTAAAQAMGVSCTTCHVQMVPGGGTSTGVVVSTHGAPAGSPHAVLADARMGTKDACGSCHKFDFPRVAGAPMQDTLAEHASSKYATTPCQTCHMPERTGAGGKKHRSHAFSVIGDPEMIRSAATATAERTGAKGIRVAIAPKGAGHAFPTGDMFRRLEVRAIAVDPATGKTLAKSDDVHLGRTFGDKVQGPHVFMTERVEVADTRLPPPGTSPGTSVELRFPTGIRGAEVRWQLVYQRMSSAMAASFGVDQARDEVVVAEGRLAPALSGAREEKKR
jgi:hypothetical protein